MLLLLCSAGFLIWSGICQMPNQIIISEDSGFYPADTEVTVRMSKMGPVFYTADGQAPAEDRSNVQEYTEPLCLKADGAGNAYCFRFFCQLEDGTLSEEAERNYIVFPEGRMPMTDYVISVKGGDDELFGYEEGVFVRGRLFDEYMAENPDVDILNKIIPANYFSNAELAVHASLFTGSGEELLAQDCGLKIYGRISRAKNQKSFRLIARYDYDDVNEFSYPFFPQLISDNTASPIPAYQRLSLHNAGNDNGYSFIRNTLCGELARQTGFPDVLVSRSAAVYVNDRYMGVYWLQNAFDDRYFAEKYGSYQGEMAVCERALSKMSILEEQSPLEQENAANYNDFCDWLREADVNAPEVWERVEQTLDVENLLQYVAIEYYVNNTDWPGNNVKAYRYVPAEGEEYQEDTVFDGRYRYLLYDLDYGMGLKFLGWFGRDAHSEILENLCNTGSSARLFAKLMEREAFRNAFINEVLYLGNDGFSADNVNRALDELSECQWGELEYMMEQTDILKGSLWEPDDNNIDTVSREQQSIRDFAGERRDAVLAEMDKLWDCGSAFLLSDDTAYEDMPEEIALYVNGRKLSGEDNIYFSRIPITLSLEGEGILVRGYEINGQYLSGETVEFLAGDYLEGDEVLYIAADYELYAEEKLSIDSFSSKGTQDQVILKNTGNVPLQLEDYFLSDDEREPLKGRLPRMILQPGNCITVYGKKYQGDMIQNSWQMNFSWNKEEPLILSHITEGILERRNR